MRGLEETTTIPLAVVPKLGPSTAADGAGAGNASDLSGWISDCHGLWHNLALILPSALFVAFLAAQARRSLTKLSYGRSYIMISYYGLLWAVSLLNLLWCVLQSWQCTPGKELGWNLLSVLTTSGMLFMEISLIAFLLQGNQASSVEALTRTFIISGIIISVDILLKGLYVFSFDVPLFIDSSNFTNQVKWSLWIIVKVLLVAVYGVLLFMYHSKWNVMLPARPIYYKYISAMFLLNAIALFACGLVANGAGFGFWYLPCNCDLNYVIENCLCVVCRAASCCPVRRLYNLTVVCYHSLYPPLLYITFLADFFQEEDLNLENAYYSEMKDAGFFDADWD